ncbi:hypothetical protein MACK_000344 [Theileria orientalis]|uniref:TFIIS N-terminal domain-containing protein n=1 Tax=Theileria orientalis TaxID=68886 RepID=A0A976QS12_THEOR|nr:hypothetical protein MACK_000344 [Theileria orientalis]
MDSLQNYNLDTNRDSDQNVNLVYLHPDHEKCLGRVPSLSKVDGLESNEVEVLNNWFLDNWKKIYSSGFTMNDSLTRDFTDYLQLKSPILVDLEKVDSYLSVQKLLYNGLRLELRDENQGENVSQCKLFHKYYYSCRENPLSLNNLIVLSNVIWSLKKYMKDEFALTCLVDILLQSYMVALSSFINLGGVIVLRETLEYLAQNDKLKQSTNFLLKCMDLLDKLDINFKVLQTSRIGVPVNCIALGKSHAKLKLDYECANDKVKLKATNLIKKWKAIRDASLPTKAGTNGENKMKKAQAIEGRMVSKKSIESGLEKRGEKVPSEKRAREKKDTEKGSQPEGTNNEQEGSFVLNIINTMVEQKEKEKKRKMEIRNSQMSSKYKAATSNTAAKAKIEKEVKGERSGSGENLSSSLGRKSSISSDKVEKEVEKQGLAGTSDTERDKSSTTQLASLMNFFKEYSNKTEEKGEEVVTNEVNHHHHGASRTTHTVKTATKASSTSHHPVTDVPHKQKHHHQTKVPTASTHHLPTTGVGSYMAPTNNSGAIASVTAVASTNSSANTSNHTVQQPSSSAQQLTSKYDHHQVGSTNMMTQQLGHPVGGSQQLGSAYGTHQYAHNIPIQVVGHNLPSQLSPGVGRMGFGDAPPHPGVNIQSAVTTNSGKHMGFTDAPPMGYSDGTTHVAHNVGAQQVPGSVKSQIMPQVPQVPQVPQPGPPPPPPPMSNLKHVHAQYTMTANTMQQPVSGGGKHVTGGFTTTMEAGGEQLSYAKKEYRNRVPEQTNVYSSYGVYGNVMTPAGYAPPPPPPPPAPPAPPHYQSATQENSTGFEEQKSRFSPPRNKFHSVQVNFHSQATSYESNNQENYVDDKNIEFYHSGAESSKEDSQPPVVPPWK